MRVIEDDDGNFSLKINIPSFTNTGYAKAFFILLFKSFPGVRKRGSRCVFREMILLVLKLSTISLTIGQIRANERS